MELETISIRKLLNLFLREGAIGKRMRVDFIYPGPKQMEFTIEKIEAGDDPDENIPDGVVGSIALYNGREEIVILYLADDYLYFIDPEENECMQCSASKRFGGCPFHADTMGCHCPCTVSLIQGKKAVLVESDIDRI